MVSNDHEGKAHSLCILLPIPNIVKHGLHVWVRYEEILQEMKAATGKGSRKSTGSRSPQSISLQRVASDQTSGSKSDKQRQLEEERARLDKEKADFEEWKKRFLH